MTTYYSNLLDKFKKISNEKWIKSINHDHGGVGMTFEHKLGKKSDSLFLPDYEGIELKCTTRYSNYPLYLFTIAFDGPTFPEINRLINLYGHIDKNFKDKKVLYAKLNLINSTIVNNKYKFILKINKRKDKLYLKISKLNDKLIEMKSFVYLSSIYDHVMIKLKKMAIVYASKMQKNNEDYFRYYKISIYELISYEKFIEALEKGYICVDLIARISKSGINSGKYKNKNLVFNIQKEYINEVFNKVYEYDDDTKKQGEPCYKILRKIHKM